MITGMNTLKAKKKISDRLDLNMEFLKDHKYYS